MLAVNVHRSCAQLASLEPDWNRLAGGIPFREWEWTRTWWEHYQETNKLFVLSIADNQRCIGIAPFYISQDAAGAVVRMLGDGEVCSDHLSILSLPEDAAQVAHAVAQWLSLQQRDHSPGNDVPSWDLLQLEGLDGSCPTLRAFFSSC